MQKFSQFFASRIMHQKICKNSQMCLLLKKTTLILFNIFLWLVYLKKANNENGKIRHYLFKMADNELKIWQNHLLLNLFHMFDAKFDLVSRPISHGNPAIYKNGRSSWGLKNNWNTHRSLVMSSVSLSMFQ